MEYQNNDTENANANGIDIQPSGSVEIIMSPSEQEAKQQMSCDTNASDIPVRRGSSRNASNNNNDDGIGLDELKYGMSSFHAIFTPVAVTMILAALAVTFVQLPPSQQTAYADSLNGSYNVFDVGSGNSAVKNFGFSLVNGLIIVCGIAAVTFLIVLLYKYKCMKFLVGYMILSSAALLGLLGGVMFDTFLRRYQFIMDTFTFYFLTINFAAVGTIAIFYSKGIPTYITQAYLVATSAILAWQLSYFNDWTAWTLLVLLALYDLCAVLTPCGPLKALVKLMEKNDAPEMPGLLYEARLPEGVNRKRGKPSTERKNHDKINPNANGSKSENNNDNINDNNNNNDKDNINDNSSDNERVRNGGEVHDQQFTNSQETPMGNHGFASNSHSDATSTKSTGHSTFVENNESTSRRKIQTRQVQNQFDSEAVLGILPFAICRIYKLRVVGENCPRFVTEKYYPYLDSQGTASTPTFTEDELLTHVSVLYPRHGGRILVQLPGEDNDNTGWRSKDDSKDLPRYVVSDRNGDAKRVLVMNESGKVFEEVRGERGSGGGEDDDRPTSNSIKLGLGDFIFYSVLVSKAAQNSFTTFAACMLVILAGLGGTLILLSVYHAALPALPISIFLGVVFYFITKAIIEPWVEAIMSVPFYV